GPVDVRPRRGEGMVTACVCAPGQAGQGFMPVHYEATNRLTLRSFDPHSRQPSYKHCAVALARVTHSSEDSN
ncbi:MAG: molybdopterin dinucleotide binding domain-containing protein, partial [Rubripirellula sp.]